MIGKHNEENYFIADTVYFLTWSLRRLTERGITLKSVLNSLWFVQIADSECEQSHHHLPTTINRGKDLNESFDKLILVDC